MGLRGAPLLLLLAASALLGGCSGSSSSLHSLCYFVMALSEPGQGLPQFITVGYVDEQLFFQYDSDTRRTRPRTPWMEKFGKDNPQHWDGWNQIEWYNEPIYRQNLVFARKCYNQTGGSSSSTHSLRYFYTGVSEPGQGLPWFIRVGYVDDQLFVHYDSNTRRAQPRVPWIKKVEKDDAQYWDRQSQILQAWEQTFRVNVENVRNFYNQSKGFHTVQRMCGCELRGDGTKGGYSQYGYDGRDYLAFDKETLTWTAADVSAQNTKRKWVADRADNQYRKYYLEEICIEYLRRFLDYGNETLLRTERPVVKVTSQAEHDSMETLVCRAHGFYPKAIETTWRRDGEVMEHKTFRRDVAPNSDGTYHAWLSIKVDPKDRDLYRCHVEHDSLLEPLDVAWEETGASNLGLIVGCVVGAAFALLVAGILGIYFYKKRQGGYKAASTKDQNSDSSGSNPAI